MTAPSNTSTSRETEPHARTTSAELAVELRSISKTFGSVVAVDDVSLDIASGEFFALLGPSGCGKTTTLKMMAGFEHPTSGSILINGRDVSYLPAFRRDVNMVFQDYALFPHLDIRDNVAFGLRMRGVSRRDRRSRAEEMLERVHLADLGMRRIGELSGGQQQRVALARALINNPKVLLLDEPLGALDLKLRKAMQLELKQIQRDVGISFVYVTHDQEEALSMADRIAVMHDGKALQVGSPSEIYERPSSRFVADFIGESSFLEGILENLGEGGTAGLELADGQKIRIRASAPAALSEADAAVAMVRPENVAISPADAAPDRADENLLIGTIEALEYAGSDTRYFVRIGGSDIVVARMRSRVQGLSVGDRAALSFPVEATGLVVGDQSKHEDKHMEEDHE